VEINMRRYFESLLSSIYYLGYCIDRIIHLLTYKKIDEPIISVGNITAGGAGKSTITILLAEKLISYDLSPVIISRGYNALIKQNKLVPKGAEPRSYGDEPVMMKNKLNIPVIIGKRREISIKRWLKKRKGNVFILDDGFQYYRLKRNINILLIDATEPLKNYRLLPIGRAREPISEIKRADCIIFTRVEQCEKSKLDYLKAMIRGIKEDMPFFDAKTVVKAWKDSMYNIIKRPKECKAFCAIGNPGSFKTLLEREKIKVKIFDIFKDHHDYCKKDIEKILKEEMNIVCTEKDIVKISSLIEEKYKKKILFPEISFELSSEFYFWFATSLNKT